MDAVPARWSDYSSHARRGERLFGAANLGGSLSFFTNKGQPAPPPQPHWEFSPLVWFYEWTAAVVGGGVVGWMSGHPHNPHQVSLLASQVFFSFFRVKSVNLHAGFSWDRCADNKQVCARVFVCSLAQQISILESSRGANTALGGRRGSRGRHRRFD